MLLKVVLNVFIGLSFFTISVILPIFSISHVEHYKS